MKFLTSLVCIGLLSACSGGKLDLAEYVPTQPNQGETGGSFTANGGSKAGMTGGFSAGGVAGTAPVAGKSSTAGSPGFGGAGGVSGGGASSVAGKEQGGAVSMGGWGSEGGEGPVGGASQGGSFPVGGANQGGSFPVGGAEFGGASAGGVGPDSLGEELRSLKLVTLSGFPPPADPADACKLTDFASIHNVDFTKSELTFQTCEGHPTQLNSGVRPLDAADLQALIGAVDAIELSTNAQCLIPDKSVLLLDLAGDDFSKSYQDDANACNPALNGRQYATKIDPIRTLLIELSK